MNTKDIGDISEAVAIAAFVKVGMTVLKPFGDNRRYDLVVDISGRFIRVQCKTARLKNGAVYFEPCSSYVHRGGSKKGYRGEIEFFAVYSPDKDRLYVVPVDDVGERGCKLRVDATKNGQTKLVRWARDYEFNGSFPSAIAQQ